MSFGYDGTAFQGWARQPNARTVEGEILEGIGRLGLGEPGRSVRLDVASRTDRGVSARANALALESPLSAPALLRALNGIAPEVFFRAAVAVGPAFHVRAADRRVYRYFDPPRGQRLASWRAAARRFEGEIDVRSLGRSIPREAPVWRTIDRLRVQRRNRGLEIEIVARSFVWGMVRKIVAALRELEAGRLSTPALTEALRGHRRLTLPLAEPEPLVLWDVEYPVRWTYFSAGPSRARARRNGAEEARLWARAQVLGALAESGTQRADLA